jgi:type VI secretion system protein VasD
MQTTKRLAAGVFITIVAALLTACSSSAPPQMKATIQSIDFLNPNIYNQPSPVVITIYQLKSATAFQQASFFVLANNAAAVLGSDLLDKSEMEIRPKEKQKLEVILAPTANYIGVLAAFRDPDKAQWRQVIPVTPGKKVSLQINLAAQSVAAKLK